jgi:hypothetical protein
LRIAPSWSCLPDFTAKRNWSIQWSTLRLKKRRARSRVAFVKP